MVLSTIGAYSNEELDEAIRKATADPQLAGHRLVAGGFLRYYQAREPARGERPSR